MSTRNVLTLMVAGAVLFPLAAFSPAASQSETVDLAVTSLTIGRLVYPPYRFTIAAEVCNEGTVAAGAGSAIGFTVTPEDGLARATRGPVRVVETQVLVSDIPAGACQVFRTSYGGVNTIGEYEFAAALEVAGDADPADNSRATAGAHPAALQGSGFGGL